MSAVRPVRFPLRSSGWITRHSSTRSRAVRSSPDTMTERRVQFPDDSTGRLSTTVPGIGRPRSSTSQAARVVSERRSSSVRTHPDTSYSVPVRMGMRPTFVRAAIECPSTSKRKANRPEWNTESSGRIVPKEVKRSRPSGVQRTNPRGISSRRRLDSSKSNRVLMRSNEPGPDG